jgi:hypothetical protein
VTAFTAGDAERADVVVHAAAPQLRQLFDGTLAGDDAMNVVTVEAPTGDGVYAGAPAPADLRERPELQLMPVVPEATMTLEYTLTDAPFGTIHYWMRFEDGAFTGDGFGPVEHADVRATVAYRALARVRAGDCSVLEHIEGGTVNGDIGPLALIDGLLEDPAFHAAELATGRHAFALAALGELRNHDIWTNAFAQLGTETDGT